MATNIDSHFKKSGIKRVLIHNNYFNCTDTGEYYQEGNPDNTCQIIQQKSNPNVQISYLYTLLVFLMFTITGGMFGCATQKNQPDFLKAQNDYKKALELQREKGSIAIEDEVSKKIPEMKADGYERLGDDYVRQGHLEMAFIQYDKALRLDPNQNGIRNKVGRLFLRRGMNDEAMKELDNILENDPENAFAYEGKGISFLARGELDKAIENFRQAINYDPKSWQAYTFLGIIYDRQERFEEAINEYNKAINITPNSSILYNNIGISYFLKGEYEKSVEALSKALEIEPENRKLYNNLGLALCKLGKHDEALKAFKKAEDEAGAYNNIGYIYMKEQKYNEAIDAFEKAIDIKPNYYLKAHENIEMAKAAMEKQKQ